MFDWSVFLYEKLTPQNLITAPKTKRLIIRVVHRGKEIYRSKNLRIYRLGKLKAVVFRKRMMVWVFDRLDYDEIIRELKEQFGTTQPPSKYFEICFDDLFEELIKANAVEKVIGRKWKEIYARFKLAHREVDE